MGSGPHGPLITPHMLYTCNYKDEIVPFKYTADSTTPEPSGKTARIELCENIERKTK